ncbi:hypothetical protein [Haloferula sp. BvORR071]|uniref:hypothetical protein n=1 Tax=Haloferula sp. BvORR071 TaxID=1396141 RepID=UPI00055237E3|nr:hypothetical protein [Haloferula sp. BvORR071]
MRFLLATVILATTVLPLSSCKTGDEEEQTRKAVPPPNTSSQIPWNKPVPGQGGGAFGALPNTPRR